LVNVFDAWDVARWLFFALFLPGIVIMCAGFLVSFLFSRVSKVLGCGAGGFVLSAIFAGVLCSAAGVVLFFNYPWWLGLWGYTDQYLILVSYALLGAGGAFSTKLSRADG
jgi:hypothetical protein